VERSCGEQDYRLRVYYVTLHLSSFDSLRAAVDIRLHHMLGLPYLCFASILDSLSKLELRTTCSETDLQNFSFFALKALGLVFGRPTALFTSAWQCEHLRGKGDMQSETRLFTMFAGWIVAFYGVRRRTWPGTIIAMLGLGLAEGAMTIGKASGDDFA
jgi:hypothetical protein